jgi:hypothetical protein
MKRSTKSSVVLTMAATLALSFTTLAAAQSDALASLYVSAANVPTNITSIHTYAEAPKGFNPVAATDIELATYGFPARPDKQADPDHYALWERAMAAAKIRWNGELKPLSAGGSAMMPDRSSSSPQTAEPQAVQPQTGPRHVSTTNWSGVVLQNTLKTWSNTASFNDIWTVISVPVSQLPFASGSCYSSGATDLFELSFAGIDGYNPYLQYSNGALQGGVYSDVNCGAGLTYYYAYVGWGFPTGVFPVNPGDLFYTEVHGFGGCNPGSVYVEDLTTLTYNSYSVSNVCLVPQVGNQAEWVVERFCCNGSFPYPLANTLGISFEGAAALNGSGKTFYPGSQATTTAVLTMRDDGNTQNIEIVNQGSSGFQGQHSLFVQTTGCAFAGGCVP